MTAPTREQRDQWRRDALGLHLGMLVAKPAERILALLDALDAAEERAEEVEGRLADFLCSVTGGRLSKTGYSVATMVQETEADFDRYYGEELAEAQAEIEAAEKRLAGELRMRVGVERVLDRVLGTEPEDGAGEGLAADVALAVELAWDRALDHAWQLNDPAYTVITDTESIHPILTRADIDQAKSENPYRSRS